MKLNLGCGMQVVDGWLNVDYSMGARFAKLPIFKTVNKKLKIFNVDWDNRVFLHDLTKRFPWDEASVTAVYTSHTLEHLSCQQGISFLEESFRVLDHGGVIRVLVPDLKHLAKQYLDGNIRSDDFLSELGVLYLTYNNRVKNSLAPFIQFPHKCMYDTETLISIMQEIGFEVSAKKPFESDIDSINDIEILSRTDNAVIVEAKKP